MLLVLLPRIRLKILHHQYFQPQIEHFFLAKPSSLLFANFEEFVPNRRIEAIYAGNNRFSRDYLLEVFYSEPIRFGCKAGIVSGFLNLVLPGLSPSIRYRAGFIGPQMIWFQ